MTHQQILDRIREVESGVAAGYNIDLDTRDSSESHLNWYLLVSQVQALGCFLPKLLWVHNVVVREYIHEQRFLLLIVPCDMSVVPVLDGT